MYSRKPRPLVFLSLLGLFVGQTSVNELYARALQPETESEVAVLRDRVKALEEQNAQILEQLFTIQELLAATSARPAVTSRESQASQVRLVSLDPLPTSSVARAFPVQQQAQPVVRAAGNSSQIDFYGFVRIDAIFDDSRADAFQTPTFVLSEPNGTDSQSNFTIHPRLTRFGMNLLAPDSLGSLGDPILTGRIEADFQNGGRESRAVPRMRHAFLQLDWGSHSLLAGQTSDLVSPLFPAVNGDTLMWNAGNLGDRRMQVRYNYQAESGVSLQAGIGLTGAVSPLDADSNGIRDGEAATQPNLQGRMAYGGSNLTVGAWSYYARLHTDLTFGGKDDFEGYVFGTDFEIRFTDRISVRGEAWTGRSLGDMRGGIGQSFNTVTGREIESRGGWVELGLQTGPHGLFIGYTMDDPRNEQVEMEAPAENRAWYLTNRFDLAEPLTLGVDYIHWRTHFKGLSKGTDNRVNAYLIYGF